MRNVLTAFFCALLLGLGLTADAQRLVVTDSGSVEREIKRVCVVDASSTTRCLKRLFVVDSGGTARLVFLAATVTLSGETIPAVRVNQAASAALRIGADGNMYRIINEGAPEQIDSATDWLRDGDPTEYQVRYINVVGDAPSTSPTTAEGAWHAISGGNLDIQNADTTFDDGADVTSFDIQIRKGTGPVLATGAYSLEPSSVTL